MELELSPQLETIASDSSQSVLEAYARPREPVMPTDAILQEDPFFRSLVTLNVAINYYHRTKVAGGHHYSEGVERDRHSAAPLFTATLYVGCPEIEQRVIHDDVHLRGPMPHAELERTLLMEEGDGAYVVYTAPTGVKISEDRHIIMLNPMPIVERIRERHPHMHITNYADALAHGFYLPADFVSFSDKELDTKRLGGRTRHAMTVPILLDGGKVYMIKQTVYDHGDIGKTVMFDRNGLVAEFFLAKADGLPDRLQADVTPDSYFDDEDKVVGVLRTHHPHDKLERQEYVVRPASLDLFQAALQAPYAAPAARQPIARLAIRRVPAPEAHHG